MEQEKKEFTGIFIPKHIIEDEDLSMSEMIIYSEIACFEVCYKSNESLGGRWGLKERRISEIISVLEKKGYVKRESFDGRNRQLVALRDRPSARQTSNKMLGRVAEKCEADTQKSATIDNIIDNSKDNILLLADKSANEKVSEDKPKTTLQDLYQKMGLPKSVKTVNKWQDEAANAYKYFTDGEERRSSIFKCFKDDQHHARIAFSDCKELKKRSALYFLKVYNELRKK